jgi:hypothetical protein
MTSRHRSGAGAVQVRPAAVVDRLERPSMRRAFPKTRFRPGRSFKGGYENDAGGDRCLVAIDIDAVGSVRGLEEGHLARSGGGLNGAGHPLSTVAQLRPVALAQHLVERDVVAGEAERSGPEVAGDCALRAAAAGRPLDDGEGPDRARG